MILSDIYYILNRFRMVGAKISPEPLVGFMTRRVIKGVEKDFVKVVDPQRPVDKQKIFTV